MNTNRRLLLLGAVAIGVCIAVVQLRTTMGSSTASQANVIEVHWVNDFQSLKEMTADSDVVVTGVIVASEPSRLIGGGLSPQSQTDIEKSGGIPGVLFTDFKLQVQKVIKGKLVEGDIITIVQTGGTYGDKVEYVADDPLFQINENALLFLNDVSGDPVLAPDGQKFTINGTSQARFQILSGQVIPMARDNAVVREFDGSSVETFLKVIENSQESAP